MTVMQKNEYYNMYHTAEYLWWYISLRELIGHYFRRHIPKKAKILDVGCGTGENMLYLKEHGYAHVQGIDLSTDSVELCHIRGLSKVQRGTITKLDFPSNTFDAVYSMDVLGSVPIKERAQAIHELFRVLKPGGWLLVQSAALEWLRSQHDTVVSVHHRFTRREFRHEFGKFDIVKLSYRFFVLFPLIGLVKLVRKPHTAKTAQSDVSMPHPLVNRLLLAVQRMENSLFTRVSLPIGTSVFLVAKKPL